MKSGETFGDAAKASATGEYSLHVGTARDTEKDKFFFLPV